MRRFTALAPLALAGFMLACGGQIDAPETTRLTIMLTDEPGDVLEAVVTISSIYLQGGSDAGDQDALSRVILLDEPVTTDLLTLVNDFETLVADAIIASGDYGQLRFVVDGGYIVVETETGEEVYATPGFDLAPAQVDGTLVCPSCGLTGIKVNFNGGLTLDASAETLLVDFSVAESFGQQDGTSGNWVMNPLLKGSPMGS
jgi:hypothetical protein